MAVPNKTDSRGVPSSSLSASGRNNVVDQVAVEVTYDGGNARETMSKLDAAHVQKVPAHRHSGRGAPRARVRAEEHVGAAPPLKFPMAAKYGAS